MKHESEERTMINLYNDLYNDQVENVSFNQQKCKQCGKEIIGANEFCAICGIGKPKTVNINSIKIEKNKNEKKLEFFTCPDCLNLNQINNGLKVCQRCGHDFSVKETQMFKASLSSDEEISPFQVFLAIGALIFLLILLLNLGSMYPFKLVLKNKRETVSSGVSCSETFISSSLSSCDSECKAIARSKGCKYIHTTLFQRNQCYCSFSDCLSCR
jgi:hypothetical protein